MIMAKMVRTIDLLLYCMVVVMLSLDALEEA